MDAFTFLAGQKAVPVSILDCKIDQQESLLVNNLNVFISLPDLLQK